MRPQNFREPCVKVLTPEQIGPLGEFSVQSCTNSHSAITQHPSKLQKSLCALVEFLYKASHLASLFKLRIWDQPFHQPELLLHSCAYCYYTIDILHFHMSFPAQENNPNISNWMAEKWH